MFSSYRSGGDSSSPVLDSASAEISSSQSLELSFDVLNFYLFYWEFNSLFRTATDDKIPSQDAIDGTYLENSLTQTSDSQEELQESQEDIKESQEKIEAKEITKAGRKNVRQAAKKDPSSTQSTGKAS